MSASEHRGRSVANATNTIRGERWKQESRESYLSSVPFPCNHAPNHARFPAFLDSDAYDKTD